MPQRKLNHFPYLLNFRFNIDDQMGDLSIADFGSHGIKFSIQLLKQKIQLPAGRFIQTSTGAYLTSAGQWTSVSDRDAKENFSAVSGRDVLHKLSTVPVSTWNYKLEDQSIRHMGPMAQDLYAAFGLGDSDKAIGAIDANGVAPACRKAHHD